MNIKILLVEDNYQLAYTTQDGLQNIIGGYEVTVARNGEEGLNHWRQESPDMIVADVDMPVMNGLEMAQRIRETDTHTPILFTCVLTSPVDVKNGLNTGADNYIKKPYSVLELHSYICAYRRRNSGRQTPVEEKYRRIGRFRLHLKEHTLTDTLTHGTVRLGRIRTAVLALLTEHPGEVVKRESFLAHVWENDYSEESLNNSIYQLRKLLAGDESVRIVNLSGVGYKLEVKS